MKKHWLAWLLVWAVAFAGVPAAHAQLAEAQVSAQSALLLQADTGEVLYEKNADLPLPMASTTKIMTALLTLEAAARCDDPLTVTQEMVAVEGTALGLQAGWKVTPANLAAGMLVASGNDAARAAAIGLAGSEAAFAQQMNERAAALGMRDTHFVTASGLDEGDHHSTARDMAILAAAAMENEQFRAIVAQPLWTVDIAEPAMQLRLANHNRLLTMAPDCVGVKTGYTKKAGRCLVSAMEREGVRLICVTLNAPDDWNDHLLLYEAAYGALRYVDYPTQALPSALAVVGGVQRLVPVRWEAPAPAAVLGAEVELSVRVEAPAFLYAPVQEGQAVGRLLLYCDGEPAGSCTLFAGKTVQRQDVSLPWWEKLWRWLGG